MSAMTNAQPMQVTKAPDKGSFPLDHFGECESAHKEYLKCLHSHKFDNMSCRYLSKKYLQCRMKHNLMAPETMENLGFTEDDDRPKPPRKVEKSVKRETVGFVSSVDRIDERGWVKPALLGRGTLFGIYDADEREAREREFRKKRALELARQQGFELDEKAVDMELKQDVSKHLDQRKIHKTRGEEEP